MRHFALETQLRTPSDTGILPSPPISQPTTAGRCRSGRRTQGTGNQLPDLRKGVDSGLDFKASGHCIVWGIAFGECVSTGGRGGEGEVGHRLPVGRQRGPVWGLQILGSVGAATRTRLGDDEDPLGHCSRRPATGVGEHEEAEAYEEL
uniref:Uncharacterized protein n=1 Tax=Opuntia streptacantha TaxID=393608 RepID=A0A7C9EAJ2_OPUST